MDLNEINENQDGLFIFVAIVGIVLFVALLVHAFDKRKKGDNKDHKAEIFKIESGLINPLDPELWSKNVAYYFVESEKDNG